ncbi:hypothetical protein G7054_g12908 [Neopestalotiopsis clavispora]|nr:hypothetical protein G7054_g12908 [Neopestalotiopsis clavispora]
MLGWALKKGVQGATGARNAPPDEGKADSRNQNTTSQDFADLSEDTTQFEAPDTPAPVFAARAIRRAIFGTPAPPKEPLLEPVARTTDDKIDDAPLRDSRSPIKPTGILLTPGTATARRKRVSFGRDVKAGISPEAGATATEANTTGNGKKSIQQRLEESRSNKAKKANEAKTSVVEATTASERPAPVEDGTDDDWEDDICNHDMTVDLNEPHSRSGKYWKSEFSKYSDDARAEMEKLVKYKHLAKCYAQKKDAEAVELNQKLKEEREKVAEMEKKIAEMTVQAPRSRGRASDTDDAGLVKKLAEKTSQAARYKERVEELEVLLLDQEDSGGKSQQHKMDTSPRTEKTLLETSRELRRARNDLKQMKKIQEENERLKSERLASDSKQASVESDQALLQKLEKQVQNAEAETQRKDRELKKLKKEFDILKENAKSSRSQALQVLKEKNDKIAELETEINTLQKRDSMAERRIAELEREVKTLLKSNTSDSRTAGVDAALAQHNQTTRDIRSEIATRNRPSIHEKAKRGQLKRAVSAEDLTLDFTQQSLFESPSQKRNLQRFSADVTDSLRDIEAQIKQERLERMESRRRDRDLDTFDLDESQYPIDSDRFSKPTKSTHNTRHAVPEKTHETLRHKTRQSAPELRAVPTKSDRGVMRDALDNITNSRFPGKAPARATSPSIDSPGFDLLQNRFAKLGGPNLNDDTALTANASRCTLPADRLAAAKARIAQKRREKRNVAGKENVRP